MNLELLSGILGALIGGLLTLIGSIIVMKYEAKEARERQFDQFAQSDKEWIRENRLKLYMELTEKLDNFKLYIDLDSITDGNAKILSEAILDNLKELNDYLENEKGYLSLFLPNIMYSEIIRFKAKIYKIVVTPELQEVNLNNPQESEFFKIIIDGKKISMTLKKSIVGIENI